MKVTRQGWRSSPYTAHLIAHPRTEAHHETEPQTVEQYVEGLRVTGTTYTSAPTAPHGAVTYLGARIRDDALGLTFEVAAERIDGRAVVRSLTVLPDSDVVLTMRTPMPIQSLADLALEHAEASVPTFTSETPPGRPASVRPSWADIARHYRQALSRGGSGRSHLAHVYGVSVRTADGWIAAARKAGHIRPEERSPRGARGTQQ